MMWKLKHTYKLRHWQTFILNKYDVREYLNQTGCHHFRWRLVKLRAKIIIISWLWIFCVLEEILVPSRSDWWDKATEAVEGHLTCLLFYHGYCKDQRNAAVIILRYTTLRHNGLWEMIHISSFDTMWRNPCIWSSKSCQLRVDFTFQMWCWPCIFRTST